MTTQQKQEIVNLTNEMINVALKPKTSREEKLFMMTECAVLLKHYVFSIED
jgi:hypothetical protein